MSQEKKQYRIGFFLDPFSTKKCKSGILLLKGPQSKKYIVTPFLLFKPSQDNNAKSG